MSITNAGQAGAQTAHQIRGGRRTLADRINNARRAISDKVHSAADAQARAQGWTVTESTDRFGMGGRTYRDPRLAVREPSHQQHRPRKRRPT